MTKKALKIATDVRIAVTLFFIFAKPWSHKFMSEITFEFECSPIIILIVILIMSRIARFIACSIENKNTFFASFNFASFYFCHNFLRK